MVQRRHSDSIRDEVVSLYESGSSSRAIAEELHVGVSFVLSVVREEGIVRPSGRPVRAS